MPNLAIIESLIAKKSDLEITYIGSYHGIEKDLVPSNIRFKKILTGKIRRYISLQNILDLIKVPIGTLQALFIMLFKRPSLVFSKGGYVAVPVVLAASMLRIKVITHESDVVPGLANKVCSRFAHINLVSFKDSEKYLEKSKFIGTPIRKEILNGSKEKGYKHTQFNKDKPVVLIMGGSSGAENINNLIKASLKELLKNTQIIWITGKGKTPKDLPTSNSLKVYEYVKEELPDLYSITDLIISRAGANSIAEIKALKKPSILIPLSKKASRGDQVINAKAYSKNGEALMLEEEELTAKKLITEIQKILENPQKMQSALDKHGTENVSEKIADLILKNA